MLSRLKYTLVSLGVALLVSVVFLVNMDEILKIYYAAPEEAEIRVIPGVYNDESARLFEPDAFCGPGMSSS